jgi:hypothetical protein
MKLLRRIRTILKYMAGVLVWLLVFGLLRYYCVFDVYSVINGLWMKELHDGLVENAIGDIAYHTEGGECFADKYIYWARYNPSEMDLEGKPRSLTSLVDVATWHYEGRESITFTYQDAKHLYDIHYISDGNFILATDR